MNEQLFTIPLAQWANTAIDWLTSTFSGLFGVIRTVLEAIYGVLETMLDDPPFLVVALVLVALAFLAKGWKLALGSAAGFAVIHGVGYWSEAMVTLALVLVATLAAVVIAIPTGIWAARNHRVSAVMRPVLDFLQTMPAFVYIIPAVVIFRVGVVPGIVATIIFALAPGVRLTELGIRQVDREVVEAGHAFGASPGRILRQIQLPLALPSIMAGINQVIMLSLSMVVIAGLVAAPGLGQVVVQAVQRMNIGTGVAGGVAVVILAMYLDRVTSALSDRAPVSRALAAARD